MKTINQILLLLSLLLCTQNSIAKPLEPLNLFDYLVRLNDLSHTPLDQKTVKVLSTENYRGCIVEETQFSVHDPLAHTFHLVKMAIYHPPMNKKIPAIVIVPTILGRTVLENSVAYRFCMTNMVAAIADVNSTATPDHLPDWELHDRMSRRAILEIKSLIDYLVVQPQVDATKIGAYGISLGAYTISLLAAVDPRLKSVVLILGAGNMPAILSNSQQRIPVKLRNLRMNATGDKSVINYETNLRKSVNYDPIYMLNEPEPKKYFMLIDLDDTYVPTENQLELWEKLGKPSHFDVHATHDQSILAAVTVHFNRILNELTSRLK